MGVEKALIYSHQAVGAPDFTATVADQPEEGIRSVARHLLAAFQVSLALSLAISSR